MIIGIDGVDGAGKSFLAREICHRLGGKVVSLDDYLNTEQGGYVGHIRYGELYAAIENASKVCSHLIIEGCCLLSILGRISCSPDLVLYVKKLRHGVWLDGMTRFPSDKSPDEVIREINGFCTGGAAEEGLGIFDSEVIRYHYDFSPHQNADVIFERDEA